MKRLFAIFTVAIAASTASAQWSQFGGNPRHTSSTTMSAQAMARVLADVVHDPEVSYELQVGGGSLNVHYAGPLLDGDDVFMSFKAPSDSGSSMWDWSVHRLHWENGQLVDKWTAALDYQPVPSRAGLWEPVLQPVLANGFIYAPAFGGSLQQIDRTSGSTVRRINPFGVVNAGTFVSGPPATDSSGNIFYTAFRMQSGDSPWFDDIDGAWLIRVSRDGSVVTVPFSTLVRDAPKADDACRTQFTRGSGPIPPTPTATPPATPCGSQRPGLNVAPAIAADGTIYLLSRSHLNDYYSYLVAVNPDLTAKWDRSLRLRFHDGCNVTFPPNGTPGGCPAGTTTGVDPNTNEAGSGRVNDLSTASPVVASDGSIIYGAHSSYNFDQGHLMHFGSDGSYLGDYPFGWDTTPAVWQHDGTYSIVTKENHYDFASQPAPGDFITQLDPHFNVEWQYRNPSRIACHAENDCDEETYGFEFCVNAPAVDVRGTVYANSEDGVLYAIRQGGVLLDRLPLGAPEGSAYTPLAIDNQGRVYAEAGGHLLAVGGVFARRRATK
jgi:outer membrane protein assembly factor BamB